MSSPDPAQTVAALDLGSNSFHMIVARVHEGHVHVLDRLKETVRLAGGLDEHHRVTREAEARALGCLERFGQRIRDLHAGSVRAVGTNTLRKARNADRFLPAATAALGHPIEVIGGREEARLIYLGVAHSVAEEGTPRLVVDIGGGSTELILGQHFEPVEMESLHMGCVTMTQAYFGDGRISRQRWHEADTAARLELRPIEQRYRSAGWSTAVGASGTVLAVERVVREMGWSAAGITREALQRLRDTMIDAGQLRRLKLAGLSKERLPVFPGGVAVLLAVFESLGIERMGVAEGALREGLIYDLVGRIQDEDLRDRTIEGLGRRFQIDRPHMARVERTASMLFGRLRDRWGLEDGDADLLSWAARVHEIGLLLSHSQYHKHGAYILANSDLPGFSRQVQQILAVLVRAHRRKFPLKAVRELPPDRQQKVMHLAMILRLAVLLCRSRVDESIPLEAASPIEGGMALTFEPGWLDVQPLTQADLEQERERLATVGLRLRFR